MSDFFYKETIGPMFSPVIKVSKKEISPTLASAIDGLLNPSGNMFTRAETVKNLMKLESLSLQETAKVLSLKMCDVSGKLRLLEFSESEREAVLEYGFCEKTALKFLELDKHSRLYAMEYCKRNGYDFKGVEEYVDGIVNQKQLLKEEKEAKQKRKVKTIGGCDIGFFFNSIEKAVMLAKHAGFIVNQEREETENEYNIHINVKKQ